MLHCLSVSELIHLNVLSTEFNYGTKYSVKHKTPTLYSNNRAAKSIPQLHSTLLSQKWSQGLYLIPGSELMNGKDLCRVQRLTEDVNGSELPTEHPVSIRSLWRAQETFIITLQEGRKEEEIIKIKELKRKNKKKDTKSGAFYQFDGLRVFRKGPLERFTCYLLVILFWIS